MLDEPLNLPSDSECSVDSTKVEIDSLCLDDEEFAPSMIQDFKYDDNSTRSIEGFLDSNLNVMGQKDDILDLRNGDLSRIRTSTKKEESGSSDVVDSTENSLAGSNHDLSDDTTISDSESITRLRESLHSKVRYFNICLVKFSKCLSARLHSKVHYFNICLVKCSKRLSARLHLIDTALPFPITTVLYRTLP